MTVTARVLPDGSVSVTDGGTTYAPMSAEAVQAIAGQAEASAAAGQMADLTSSLVRFAGLLAQVGPAARVTLVLDGSGAHATVDPVTFGIVQTEFAGKSGKGNWTDGALTFTQAQRTVTDGITTASATTVTSATANFQSWDQGLPISGGSVPAGTTITKVSDPQTVTVSAPATASTISVTVTIG